MSRDQEREDEKVEIKLELGSDLVLCDDAVLRRSRENYLEEAIAEDDIVAWTNGCKSFATVKGKTISLPSCNGSRCLAWGPKESNEQWLAALELKTFNVRLYVLRDKKTIILRRTIKRRFDRPFRIRWQQQEEKKNTIFIVADRNAAHLFSAHDESYYHNLKSPVRGKLEAVSWIGTSHIALAAGGEVRVVWNVLSNQDKPSHALLADGPSSNDSSSSVKSLCSAARSMNVTRGNDENTFFLFITVEASLVLDNKKNTLTNAKTRSSSSSSSSSSSNTSTSIGRKESSNVREEEEKDEVLDLRGKVRVQQQSTNVTSNLFNIFDSSSQSSKNVLFDMMSSNSSSSYKKISSQLLVFEITTCTVRKGLRPLCRVSMPWWLEAPDLLCIQRREKQQFIDLAIASHSSTKMLCMRLAFLKGTIITRRCVVSLAANMRLKGMYCSRFVVHLLYAEHHKSRHTFHTANVIPSKLILDVSRDLFRVCFPKMEKEESESVTKESGSSNGNGLKETHLNLILSAMESHYTKLSKRLESVESRCEHMESMLKQLVLSSSSS